MGKQKLEEVGLHGNEVDTSHIRWHRSKSTHPRNYSLYSYLFSCHSPQPLCYALEIPKGNVEGQRGTYVING